MIQLRYSTYFTTCTCRRFVMGRASASREEASGIRKRTRSPRSRDLWK